MNMPIPWKKLSLLSALLILGLLLATIPSLASASKPGGVFLPTPVPPEPYPNTDIYPAVVYLATSDDLQVIYRLRIDFEGIQPADGTRSAPGAPFEPAIATIYIDPSQSIALSQAGLSAIPIPNEGYRSFLAYGPGSDSPYGWPTFDEYVTRMQILVAAHPDIMDLEIIGYSVQGRGLYCMKVTDNPGMDEYEPEFKYTANHHGDETTGIEMVMRLAELLANSYTTDPNIAALVDNMEIWLCPIYNPDGYVSGDRYNANGIDLNRNFPDRFMDPIDDPAGHEPETQAFMYFGYDHRFVMGANYHGGAQVLNYPWDAVSGQPYYAPDDQLFFDLGYGYTSRNTDLWNGGWQYGMTRGWEWYMIYGGMQDWAYYWHNEHHVTLEISDNKSPQFTQMDTYWNHNRDAMLWWMERAQTGLSGLVLDARDNTPLDGTVTLVGRAVPNIIPTDPDVGDYHRVIGEGDYTLMASVTGFQSQSASVTVISGTATTQDFYLCPEIPWVVSGTVTEAGTGLPLQATIEFVGSPLTATTNPATGYYSIDVCPSSYIMRASAPLHIPEERPVTIDQSQTQDFALLPIGEVPDLSPSTKDASVSQALPQDVVQYQLFLDNAGITTTVMITDTLPPQVIWTGYLTATQGIPSFEGGNILWQGEVSQSQPVTITYAVSLYQCLAAGTDILNIAQLDDGMTNIITRTAQVTVTNAVPSEPSSPSPADGAVTQPLTSTLAWVASTDLNCDAITYDIAFGTSPNPPIVVTDTMNTYYDPGVLLPNTTYYWYVIAKDGLTQTPGPTWSFTTHVVTILQKIFLPLTIK
jgi:Zinc carboxypeptidase